MRQRVKLASALVHDPAVLLLDEPFNGVDPRQRLHLMSLLRRMGAEGRTVLFSSHILEEVEQVARQIEVVVSGRHAASGDFGQIRRLMTDRPVQYVVVADDDRRLAAALMAEPSVVSVSLRSAGGVDVSVCDFGAFAVRLPRVARSRSGSSSSSPATSPSRACSPTWWGSTGERHHPATLRAGPAGSPAGWCWS